MPDYRICGLTIHSTLALPGAIPLDAPPGSPDVQIRISPVPERLAVPITRGPWWELADRQFLLTLPEIGRFCATEGKTLDLEPTAGTDPADAVPFLLGTGLGALLYQRGALILHAAAVERDGAAIAICGKSGMGKSTLAAALCQSGCALVSDDLTVIRSGDDGQPMVWPDGRYLKLFDDAIDHLELGNWKRDPVRVGIDKHYVAPTVPTRAAAVPLRAVYELNHQQPRLPSEIHPLTAMDGVQTILNQTYRRRLALALAPSGSHMAVSATLFRHVPVFQLRRQFGLGWLGGDVAHLLAHWHGLDR
jgi:hypothetical protein